ncbi:RluA family pseudouridine synthase [Gardnerella piotii]|uniref:Pseudouridine synthase n=1 Tax=Gardnerella pickettii JCP7719 TaxID=1261061 RepID=S4GXJ4_9BIFI|nr:MULTISPECIES: RluA family pseudouridine synthase [Gardnerella]MDK7784703.1 RluA family pseudouridine synthase [Bifidobacterium sp. UMB6791B]MDK8248362.1 RluA family pseudouridine synthase [Bifidobacterium sp. UMB6794B]MDK8635518.1 RluA family pseudouridine synthase [Bifidobacterium sp. UMB6791A]EPI51651.1 pseudouridine synthase, RluA family [Gardnerella pickettii JCP7719]RDX00124.1 pseudouridine synthase [Gardnerella vaginalis]
MSDIRFTVTSQFAGCRFDVCLSKLMGVSRANAISLIDSGKAKILNRKSQKSSILQESYVIVVNQEDDCVSACDCDCASACDSSSNLQSQPAMCDLEIVYNDDDVVVINKPVAMASHAAKGWNGPTVPESLEAAGIRINTTLCDESRKGIVSRLDVGTSGLMLVCKTDFAYEKMKQQFASHSVSKTYTALVQGNLEQNKATIEAPIGRSKVSDFRFTVTKNGKPAVTHWDVLERFGIATLVSVNLETGRTHQIRVHFSSIGHPLVADKMYGANPKLAEKLELQRQWLHSTKLEFKHPRTGKLVKLESEYPLDLQHALQAVRQL